MDPFNGEDVVRTQPSCDEDDGGDDELLRRLRGGDEDAFGELFCRHYGGARRYATRLLRRHDRVDDADDVASDAFRKVLVAIRNGNGPVDGFRKYLYVTVRAMTVTHLLRLRGERVVDSFVDHDHDAADATLDGLIALNAFHRLPRRWQQVLWATKVLTMTPTEFGATIGLEGNAAAKLSLRARDALRLTYLRSHLPPGRHNDCRGAMDDLARRLAARGPADASGVDDHLRGCAECAHAVAELHAALPTWTAGAGASRTA
jgi:RNA polymerase sigma factor (sigma-70 family)